MQVKRWESFLHFFSTWIDKSPQHGKHVVLLIHAISCPVLIFGYRINDKFMLRFDSCHPMSLLPKLATPQEFHAVWAFRPVARNVPDGGFCTWNCMQDRS